MSNEQRITLSRLVDLFLELAELELEPMPDGRQRWVRVELGVDDEAVDLISARFGVPISQGFHAGDEGPLMIATCEGCSHWLTFRAQKRAQRVAWRAIER